MRDADDAAAFAADHGDVDGGGDDDDDDGDDDDDDDDVRDRK